MKKETTKKEAVKLKDGDIINVVKKGRVIKATIKNTDTVVTSEIPQKVREQALNESKSILYKDSKFELVIENYIPEPVDVPNDMKFDMDFVHNCYKYKPKELIIKELKWKYLMRNIVKGKNIMMVGMAGSGKTMTAKIAAKIANRELFYFNLGATQDPRATLIGNTFFNKEDGTFFSKSKFVQAIETPNAVILLDEISRAHPEAWNILMTVLDEGQRYLRLDEADGQETIKVAEGVSFIATANIGSEYTSTRVFDRALIDRFATVEMDLLNEEEEITLLSMMYPNVEARTIKALAKIADQTRVEVNSETAHLNTAISTRMTVQIAEMLDDKFELMEAMDVCVIPFYDAAGGANSERTYVKQLIQKNLPVDEDDKDLMKTGEKEDDNSKISDDNPFK